jgi:glucose-1-phosphatase
MISTIIFDWGGIFTKGEHTPIWTGLIEEKYGVANVRTTIRELILAMDVDKISFTEFVRGINSRLNINTNEEEMKEFFAKAIQPNPEMIAILKSIKNYKLLMLSNNNYTNVEAIKENYPEMLQSFEKLYFSNELKLSKPDLRIYRHLLDDSKLKAEECIFIDDKEKNIIAGKEIGIKGVWFKDIAQFRQEMTNLGIKLT